MPRGIGRYYRGGRDRGRSPKYPPGLKGKDIGLYYKNLNMRGQKLNKEKELINLRIPRTVLSGVYKCVERIEKIARERNIYLPPARKLEFVETKDSSDFIPLKIPDSEELTYSVSNIHQRDDDVILVKTEKEVLIISDSSSDEEILDEAKKVSKHAPTESLAQEIEPVMSAQSSTKCYESNDIFVSNNYQSCPSTSANKSNTHKSEEFKYEYDDIITGTFAEKLDDCLKRGIEITLNNEETKCESQKLKDNVEIMLKNNSYKKMMEFRKTLPAYKKGEQVLDVINNNQVTVISGETGCGKSTQVPQLILDEAIQKGRGANVKILVTEPRRIAASSLASRVAQERGEHPGTSTGYAVRLETVPCRARGSIMFCTTGVLLVELEMNQALSAYSHIILDEVHERDSQIDIAMCILKQVLSKRKDLKLILMSATIDADSLSKYYDNCPMIHIEGLAYPVKDVFLEDILEKTKFQLPPNERDPRFSQSKPWHKYVKKGRQEAANIEKDVQYRVKIGPWLESKKRSLSREVYKTLQDSRVEELNFDLILEVLMLICRDEPGAVLVFLPGIGEISKLMRLMNESREFPPSSHEIFALHSKLPTLDQNKIFSKPPNNVRKIILATNIAETSITIDDVVYVVDCGKIKYSGLNVEKNVATLKVEWISKANMRQRRGRAGRCQPGICYHLFTSYHAECLDDRLLPELQRSNLLEPVLAIKKLRLGKAEEALSLMPAVPAEKTIKWAVKHLQSIGALDVNETLTPLGWHVARLPVHPAAGKLLVLGALFGCLDRAASVAAVWGFKEPFQLVIGKEREIDQARRELALGEPSDHVAISEAIIQWEKIGSNHQRRQFANHYFLSHNTLQLLSDMKNQFAGNLKQMGFLRQARITSERENRNSGNLSLFKALVAASLYPNIATVRWMNQKPRSNKPLRIKAYTPEEGRVSLHPSSVMNTRMDGRQQSPICTNVGANWLVYWLKQKSSDLFLFDVTCVYTLPLLFFGELKFTKAVNPDDCEILISSVRVSCKKEAAQLLFQMRSLLDKVLAHKIMHSIEHTPRSHEFEEEVLNAVINLITAEDERTQYLGDDDDDDEHY